VISQLTQQTRGLQTSRKSADGLRHLENLRSHASGVFGALAEALECACPHQHRAGIFIGGIKPVSMDRFTVIVTQDHDMAISNTSKWWPLTVEIISDAPNICATTPAAQQIPIARDSVIPHTRKKRVLFAPARCPSGAIDLRQSSISMAGVLGEPENSRPSQHLASIVSLCSSSRQSPIAARLQHEDTLMADVEIMDAVVANIDRFRINHCLTVGPECFRTTCFLQQLLNGKSAGSLTFSQMLDLSVTVSHAVLALYETPWLPFELMKQNIAVMGNRHAPGSKTCVTAPLQRSTIPKGLTAPLTSSTQGYLLLAYYSSSFFMVYTSNSLAKLVIHPSISTIFPGQRSTL
jgi:hypothetical protein